MHHVALFVSDLEACERFYVDLLGMQVEWRPDPDNVYLCSGSDNLALHRARNEAFSGKQRLDHIGFIMATADAVDQWHAYLSHANVRVLNKPVSHRDGARSFYCLDPAGVKVQIIYHPPIANS
jgi:catechol 2,3-dioxygenase-like lactoylglutathione lyase family enzyme